MKKIDWAKIENEIQPKKWVRVEKGIYLVNRTYHIKYSIKGKAQKETTGIRFNGIKDTNIGKVRDILTVKKNDGIVNKIPALVYQRTTFEDLAADYITAAKNKGNDLVTAAKGVKHLAEFFGGYKAVDITTDKIQAYIISRQKIFCANGYINRDLAALRRMFKLGLHHTPAKVQTVPYIPFLIENNVRKGFFTTEVYLQFKALLPDWFKGAFIMGYFLGMRVEEILNLTWDHIDMEEGLLRLEQDETKNDTGRQLALNLFPDLWAAVQTQQVLISQYPKCNLLFHHDGKKIVDFRAAWDKALLVIQGHLTYKCRACNEAIKIDYRQMDKRKGISCPACGAVKMRREDRIFHDLRRTALREMRRAGVSEAVAMAISGHKTFETFRRYDITDGADIKQAAQAAAARHAEKIAALTQEQPEPTGPNVVNLSAFRRKKSA